MWNGWLAVGGTELVNTARTIGYAKTAGCHLGWMVERNDLGIRDALEQDVYTHANIGQAPWYDYRNEASTRFYGVYGIQIKEASGSTRQADITEGITDGGTANAVRHSGRAIRVRAWLSALGNDALEYGMSWLDSALQLGRCGLHADSCGKSDLTIWAGRPRQMLPDEPVEEYLADVRKLRRTIHDVTGISGPLTVENRISNDGMHYGRLIEFTLYAGKPWVYADPRVIDLLPTDPSVIQDTPFNLVPVPSAEQGRGGWYEVAKNHSANPSVETNDTGWAKSQSGAVIAANVVGGRSTLLAAVGVASYRSRMTATATAATGAIMVEHTVTLDHAVVAGERASVSLWANAAVVSGTAVIADTQLIVVWRDVANAVLRTDTIGTYTGNTGALSQKSIVPPLGATNAILRAQCNLTSWSNGAIIDLYADAAALTTP
jgi:hypothetical protein